MAKEENIDYEKWGLIPVDKKTSEKEDFSSWGMIPINENVSHENKPEMVDTFLGSMQKNNPQFKFGTPENKQTLQDLMMGLAGNPGIRSVGNIEPNIISKGLTGLKNIFTNSFKNLKPYEEAAQKAGQEYEAAHQAAQPIKPGIIKNPTTELENIENEIGKHINVGEPHHEKVGKYLQSRIADIQNYWKDSYKNFLSKIKDTNYEMPENAMENLDYEKLNPTQLVKKYGADAYDALKKGKMKEFLSKQAEKELPENSYYKKILNHAPTSKDTNAHTFLSKYKDLRDYIYKLGQDLDNPNISSVEKEKISEALKMGKNIQKQSKEVLSKGLGEHLPEFEWLNEGYSKELYPLMGNKIAKKAIETGKLSKDMINELGGSAEGQELLRNIVKSDPEAVRNILGQVYKKYPSKLYESNSAIQEYLNESPEFSRLLSKREETLRKLSEKENISLKEKIRVEKELSDIKKAKKKARTKLTYGIGSIAASAVGIPSYHKISSLLGGD